ncbi:MAG: hemolysin family protein, partial [Armatimonadota bacterium]|nr:hemolysin family protein [Armatimonadota bacterium]
DIVEESEKEGVLEEQETEMIHSVLEFTDIVVREVMVPRIDMVCVEVSHTIDDLLDVILKSGHSRIPIYEETVDNIVGIVHAKDLLRVVRTVPGEHDIRSANVMRPVYYVPETMKVDDLLAQFQRSKHQLAIVVDEYGGTAGLVTLEDLIEEIVGPITDEYDVENEPKLSMLEDGSAIADARMPIDDVNKLLGLRLPDEESETLGGFVFTLLGKIPVVGESVEYDGVRLEVVEADNRRVARVKIAQLPEESTSKPEGDAPSSATDDA